jgi:hypothetical protein
VRRVPVHALGLQARRLPGTAAVMSTVGETRAALSALTGLRHEDIRHYAMVIDTEVGPVIKFCCDDRKAAAVMLTSGAGLLVTQPGEALGDGPVPPMPEN